VVKVFTRMLDNVVEINGLPLGEQRDEILQAPPRHGLPRPRLHPDHAGMRYGDARRWPSPKGCRANGAGRLGEALELAREKGPAPIMDDEFVVTPTCSTSARRWSATAGAGRRRVPGRVLHARYSRYMQQVAEVAPELVEEAGQRGRTLHPPQLDRADRHDPCRWPTTPATASSRASRITTSAT
jgi:ribonucleoside-diphosphate reductase alpha chain